MRLGALTCLLLIASAAGAQVGLPSMRLPQVPGVLPNLPAAGVPLDIDKSAAALAGEVDPRRLREPSALRIRASRGRHREVLEGEGRGTHIVVLHASGSTARALERLRGLDPAGVYDFNHVYTDSGALRAADMSAAQPAPAPGGVPRAAEAYGVGAARLGLIDSGVDVTHEVFSGVQIQQHGCTRAVPASHGTAVASLMVGRASAFHGAAPGSALYAVDVFCGLATGGAVDAVAEAFAWLLHEQVPVINVSLVGPPNRTLASIVQNVLARGHLVVAAVGNDGPAAPPQYPAAWPGVVGVTAVDARQQVLVEAQRVS